MKTKRKHSRQREEQPPITPSITFTRMNRCPKCGANREGFEFLIRDEQAGERTARPEELMRHGFHVPPSSVDLVASLIAQQIAKWNGLTNTIPGVAVSDDSFNEPVNDQSDARKPRNRIGSLFERERLAQERFSRRYDTVFKRMKGDLIAAEKRSKKHKLPEELVSRLTNQTAGQKIGSPPSIKKPQALGTRLNRSGVVRKGSNNNRRKGKR